MDSWHTFYVSASKNSNLKKTPQEPEIDLSIRKSNRNMTTKKDSDVNLNFPLGTPIDEILQLTLRDMILETEEKIQMGMLGSLRVEDRDKWRTAIEQGNYIREAELDWGGRKRISQFKVRLLGFWFWFYSHFWCFVPFHCIFLRYILASSICSIVIF